ncbi:MAG: MliC family protein [Halioglobus sp.]
MRYPALLPMLLIAMLSACTTNDASEATAAVPGSQRDDQGCITSAGYRWCERTGRCERPWELAQAQGFDNTDVDFNTFCSTGNTTGKRIRFDCERGESIEVIFSGDGSARVYRGDGVSELPQSPAASGYHYTNGKLGIRGKGEELMLEVGRMAPIPCRAADT